jgi:hypothetical protein
MGVHLTNNLPLMSITVLRKIAFVCLVWKIGLGTVLIIKFLRKVANLSFGIFELYQNRGKVNCNCKPVTV